VVLVETLDDGVGEEIIIRRKILSLTPCPVHILFLPPKTVIVICQTQYQLYPILPRLSYHKIQPLYPQKKWQTPRSSLQSHKKKVEKFKILAIKWAPINPTTKRKILILISKISPCYPPEISKNPDQNSNQTRKSTKYQEVGNKMGSNQNYPQQEKH